VLVAASDEAVDADLKIVYRLSSYLLHISQLQSNVDGGRSEGSNLANLQRCLTWSSIINLLKGLGLGIGRDYKRNSRYGYCYLGMIVISHLILK
jgi:hypothetical protein